MNIFKKMNLQYTQRSYIYVLMGNSKSPILNFPLKHKYTITVHTDLTRCQNILF